MSTQNQENVNQEKVINQEASPTLEIGTAREMETAQRPHQPTRDANQPTPSPIREMETSQRPHQPNRDGDRPTPSPIREMETSQRPHQSEPSPMFQPPYQRRRLSHNYFDVI